MSMNLNKMILPLFYFDKWHEHLDYKNKLKLTLSRKIHQNNLSSKLGHNYNQKLNLLNILLLHKKHNILLHPNLQVELSFLDKYNQNNKKKFFGLLLKYHKLMLDWKKVWLMEQKLVLKWEKKLEW